MKESYSDTGGKLPGDRETSGKSRQGSSENGAYQAETLKWQEAQLSKLKVTNASLQEAVAWRERQVKALDKAQAYLEDEIERLHRTITSNDEALAWRAEQVEELEKALASLEKALASLEKASASKDETLEWRRKKVEQLQGDLAYLEAKHDTVSDQLRDIRFELDLIRESTGWKMLERIWRFRDRALPKGGSGRAIYDKVIGLLRSRLGA